MEILRYCFRRADLRDLAPSLVQQRVTGVRIKDVPWKEIWRNGPRF